MVVIASASMPAMAASREAAATPAEMRGVHRASERGSAAENAAAMPSHAVPAGGALAAAASEPVADTRRRGSGVERHPFAVTDRRSVHPREGGAASAAARKAGAPHRRERGAPREAAATRRVVDPPPARKSRMPARDKGEPHRVDGDEPAAPVEPAPPPEGAEHRDLDRRVEGDRIARIEREPDRDRE